MNAPAQPTKLAVYCISLVMLALVSGCPPTVSPCASNPCDDGDPCTVDTCTDVPDEDGVLEAVCSYEYVECPEGEVCDAATGECVDLCADVVCDDNDLCTTDTCAPETGECVYTPLDCDDGNLCTIDECNEGKCVHMGPDCEVCDPATGECVECLTDADCDDGLFCTGVETCDLGTNECVAGADPCEDGAACDEGANVCLEDCLCAVDADCDDGMFCNGVEMCFDCVCVAGTNPCDQDEDCSEDYQVCALMIPCEEDYECDDGMFCNGEETCFLGGCIAGTDPCTVSSQDCDEDADACIDITPCSEDADCDDGLFCSGVESCVEYSCIAGEEPCAEDEYCDESNDTCTGPDGPRYILTPAQDIYTGGDGDDFFYASLVLSEEVLVNTLQSEDYLDGRGGTDTLVAQLFHNEPTTIGPTLLNLEILMVSDIGSAPVTFDASDFIGLAEFNLSACTNANPVSLINLANPVDLSLTNMSVAASLSFDENATAGSADELTVTVGGLTAGTVTLATGGTNGLEVLNIVAMGTINTISDIVMNGTSLATLNVSGDVNLTISESLPASITTIDALAATGDICLTANLGGDLTYTGGEGDDTLILGDSYTTSDTIDGGGGSNTLGLTADVACTTVLQTNVTHMQSLCISDVLQDNLIAQHWGATDTIRLEEGSAGGFVRAPSGLELRLGARGTNPIGNGTLIVSITGSATDDYLTFTADDCDQFGMVSFHGIERVNLVSNPDLDGSAASGGTNLFAGGLTMLETTATEMLVVTGTQALRFDAVVTANLLDARAFTARLLMAAPASSTGGVTVWGGTNADVLYGSGTADIILGGAGDDHVHGGDGRDEVAGGAGADVFWVESGAAADRVIVTDFDDTAGTGDILNLSSEVVVLDGTDDFASAAALQNHAAAGNLTIAAATQLVVVTSGTVADWEVNGSLNGTNLLAAIGGTITAPAADFEVLLAVASPAGEVGIYLGASGVGNTDIAGEELDLVALLRGTGVALTDLVYSNFRND